MENKVNGNVEGIRNTLLERIAALYEMRMEANVFASFELLEAMAEYTGAIGRELSVYIGRDGRVTDVSIGDSGKVSMPNMRLAFPVWTRVPCVPCAWMPWPRWAWAPRASQ